MAAPLSAKETFDREFLEIRCKILELAAAFDRLDRGEGGTPTERRLEQIREALAILLDEQAERAERVQMVFSRPYETSWQQSFKLTPR